MALDLPKGFEDAPHEMKREILLNKKSSELADEIREELGGSSRDSPQLDKLDKAEILLALR